MSTKPSPKVGVPKRWRLRGIASDGLKVTLGRYETEAEAQADSNRLSATGAYRDLAIEPLEVKPAPEPEAK